MITSHKQYVIQNSSYALDHLDACLQSNQFVAVPNSNFMIARWFGGGWGRNMKNAPPLINAPLKAATANQERKGQRHWEKVWGHVPFSLQDPSQEIQAKKSSNSLITAIVHHTVAFFG